MGRKELAERVLGPLPEDVEAGLIQDAAAALLGRGRGRRRVGLSEADVERLPRDKKVRSLGKRGVSTDARGIVEHIAGLGFSLSDIKALTGLSSGKLGWMKRELRAAVLRKDLFVAESAYHQAVGGPERDWAKADGIMTRWWLERRKPEWRRPSDKVIGMGQNANLDRLTNDELEQLERLLAVASGIGGGEGRPATSVIEHDGGDDEWGGSAAVRGAAE